MVTFFQLKENWGTKPVVNYYYAFNIHLYNDANRENGIGTVNFQNTSH